MQLRQSPSGPPIRGRTPGETLVWTGNEWRTATLGFPPGSTLGELLQWGGDSWVLVGAGASEGQVLTWNALSERWEPRAGGSAETAWDHIITDLPSWEAAVGAPIDGVYTMPAGSYALKNDLRLADDHRILIPSGAEVLFKSMGKKMLTTDARDQPGLTVSSGATLRAEQLQLRNNAVGATAVRTSGTMLSQGCTFQAGAGAVVVGVTVSGGLLLDFGSYFFGTVEGLRSDAASSPDAEIWLNGTRIACGFSPGTHTCVRIKGPTSTLSLQGSFWLDGHQNFPDGVRIEANFTSLQVNGGEASGLEDAIQHVSGTTERATIMNFSVSGSVKVGIDWPKANIPRPQGLTLIGNVYNSSEAAHQNFTATDPRVMVRGCLDSGGPMKETPLVT